MNMVKKAVVEGVDQWVEEGVEPESKITSNLTET